MAIAATQAGSTFPVGSAAAQVADDDQGTDQGTGRGHPGLPGGYDHLVVIYEENHSFDNLYGGWGRVGRDRVDGLQAMPDATQVDQHGTPFGCLPQNDVNLTSPPLSSECSDPAHGIAASHFRNQPFTIDDFIAPGDRTCPSPDKAGPANGVPKDEPGALPGGCTRDLVHRFYQEQFQIDGGRQDRYVSGSDAIGLTMGRYATDRLPIYRYLHSAGAPHYVIADRFFQAAFGGSFLNHQWLIAARSPLDTSHGASGAANSVLDANGMPVKVGQYPQYTPTRTDGVDVQLTQECAYAAVDSVDRACGDFAVNTIQPASPPHTANPVRLPLIDDTQYPNIGDRMSDAGISWAWYAGGWDDAEAGHPGGIFQFHHQPFDYFAAYAPGQPGRAHLQDETRFRAAVADGTLPTVSFVKPYGAENEHPGYASEPDGSDHLVDLLREITSGPEADSTLVVVTYDEFGGQWDHVAPPGQGETRGAHDAWGPGTRIPALVLSASLKRSGVDHRVYDTTSILAMIEHSFGLEP
ncbi:MAG: phosphoesterase, partial [Catenulispora sp.]|nr:phosphoesterase [Catenulispora sp.]